MVLDLINLQACNDARFDFEQTTTVLALQRRDLDVAVQASHISFPKLSLSYSPAQLQLLQCAEAAHACPRRLESPLSKLERRSVSVRCVLYSFSQHQLSIVGHANAG